MEKNMVLCPKKFQVGQKFSYGGFVLDAKQGEAVKILPEESQLTELLEMHSFLGLLNTMKIWWPALSPHTAFMRSLAIKDVIFRWGEDLQN